MRILAALLIAVGGFSIGFTKGEASGYTRGQHSLTAQQINRDTKGNPWPRNR